VGLIYVGAVVLAASGGDGGGRAAEGGGKLMGEGLLDRVGGEFRGDIMNIVINLVLYITYWLLHCNETLLA